MNQVMRPRDRQIFGEPDGNGLVRCHHLGIAVPALEPTIPMYADIFGYRLQSGPFEDQIQRVKVCFLGKGEAGEVLLELVAPLAENTPIKGVLAKGGGAYHICFEARDIEKTLADVARKGCVIVSQPVPAMAFDCRRIAWFFTPTGQLVELVETAFKDDETISSAPK